MRQVALLLVAVLSLAACATPQTELVLTQAESAGLPLRGNAAGTTFYPQRTLQCGPAALSSALNWSGLTVIPDDIAAQVMTRDRQGSLALDLMTATRRHGRLAYPIRDLPGVLREVAAGRPVVILQNLGLSFAPEWHFAVVVGYDLPARTIYLHSGTTPNMAMPLSTFEHTWARADNWALLTLPPDKLPTQGDRSTYLAAAAALEGAGQTTPAAKAYGTALTAWPNDLAALMGMGNTSYKLGRKSEAREAFRAAVKAHPNAPDAYNNLAHLLMEERRFNAAFEAIDKAIALGGPNLGVYRQTRDDILKARLSARR